MRGKIFAGNALVSFHFVYRPDIGAVMCVMVVERDGMARVYGEAARYRGDKDNRILARKAALALTVQRAFESKGERWEFWKNLKLTDFRGLR